MDGRRAGGWAGVETLFRLDITIDLLGLKAGGEALATCHCRGRGTLQDGGQRGWGGMGWDLGTGWYCWAWTLEWKQRDESRRNTVGGNGPSVYHRLHHLDETRRDDTTRYEAWLLLQRYLCWTHNTHSFSGLSVGVCGGWTWIWMGWWVYDTVCVCTCSFLWCFVFWVFWSWSLGGKGIHEN